MTPRQRAIDALELRQPDRVPHLELEMQLVEEYFGRSYTPSRLYRENPHKAEQYLRNDAELFVATADKFDYCIIHYSRPDMPWDNLEEAIGILKEVDGGRRLIMTHGDTTMAIPGGTNMEEMAYRLADRPQEVLDDAKRNVEEGIKRAEKLMAAGFDGFALCADYCFNQGPFLSPAMFEKFVTPFLKETIREYRRLGAYVIKHTDGNIMPIIDQLVDCQPHALHSLDPMAGVDIAEIKRLYGKRLCLIGNVNCALIQTGTPRQLLKECRYSMSGGKPGGGYIFSTSNCIFKGIKPKMYDLMMDFYWKNCWYDR